MFCFGVCGLRAVFPSSGFHIKFCVFFYFWFLFWSFHLLVYVLHTKYELEPVVSGHDSQQSGIRAMEESYRGMFKLTSSNYPVWKSRMRDILVCKDLWLPVQFGDKRPNKIDAAVWEALHLKATAYIRSFLDMSIYNNLGEEIEADVLWKKIGVMFENKNGVNKVSIFRKIMRLRYQDGSSMAEHINAFQGLMNEKTSLEVPLADKVFALFLPMDPFRTAGKHWL